MSLIKLAFLNPLPYLTGIGATLGTLAAKSGRPAEYFLTKVKSKPFTSPRRFIQKAGLSTFANSVNELRNGRVTDSTKILSSIADAQLGQMMNLGLGSVEQGLKKKGFSGRMTRYFTDQFIDNGGHYNIGNIEKWLKRSNKINDTLGKAIKHPLPVYGGAIGGGMKALSNDPNQQNHKLKNIGKGIIEGSMVGYGARKGLIKLKGNVPLQTAVKFSKDYFADDYWKKQLLAANSMRYQALGKVGAKMFTSTPEARAKRIAKFKKHFQSNSALFNDSED